MARALHLRILVKRDVVSWARGRRLFAWGSAFFALAAFVACSGDESSLGRPGFVDNGDGDAAGDGDLGDGDGDTLPPEVELEETFRAPVVAGPYLWSANPESNKVARINASTLDVEVLDGGHAPTYLAALPSGATGGGALVLNTLSHDASVFLIDDEGAVVSHERLSTQRGASGWSVGSEGQFAIAWSRASEALLGDLDGYQDLTVFDFRGDSVESTSLSVGFRPSKVVINDNESLAFVVSDPGISVLTLGDNVAVERELFLPESEIGGARDVSFTPDGSLAFVRVEGQADVLVVDTETNERVTVSLPGAVTDLDLSADGSTAVAVVRGGEPVDPGMGGAGGIGGMGTTESELADSYIALLSTESIFDDPSDFELLTTTEIVGSAVVANDASSVLLFTNAAQNTHLTILDTESSEMRVVDLKAPVLAAFLSDDAAFSVVLMSPPTGSSARGAFALLPVASDGPPLIEGTDTPPRFVSMAADARRALITTDATSTTRAVSYFGRFPSLQVDEVELPSRPLASGIVPAASQAFVAQEHPEGRVTFIELESGHEQTVTGFELSSRVVQ